IVRVEANADGVQSPPRREHRAADIDATARVFGHDDLEALMPGVLGRVAHAEIEREPGNKDARESALPQIAGQSGTSPAVVFVERRVRIDLAMIALAQNQLRVRDPQVLVEFGSERSLHAMVRPKDLWAIGHRDRVVWLSAGMRRGKREVTCGMPILG